MNNQDGGPPKPRMPFDPGWNDPPTLSFNTQTASKPRNLLNKRVAFPLNAQNQATPPVVPMVPSNQLNFPNVYNPPLPPLQVNSRNTTLNTANATSNPENIAFNLINTDSNPTQITHNPGSTASNLANTPLQSINFAVNTENGAGETGNESDKLLNEVSSTMNELLERNNELGPKVLDIRKRLQTMEEMWKENKLNYTIKLKMQQLADALRLHKLDEAENIQKALMVDHVSNVSSWMVGIRQLIHYCQAKEELMKIDQSEDK